MPDRQTVLPPPQVQHAARMRPLAAWRGLRRLIADPDDTAQVFEVIRALGGPSLTRGLRRFRATDVGRRVMAGRVDLIDSLRNRARLGALAAGTLGRAYHDFTRREDISADGLADASATADHLPDPDMRRYAERMRDQHDLWHIVTGYGREPFGEVCLLAFSFAQTGNRGVGVMAVVGVWQLTRSLGGGVARAVWAAYQDGRHASWLPAEDWERLLAMSLAEVRRHLAVPPPNAYLAVRADAA